MPRDEPFVLSSTTTTTRIGRCTSPCSVAACQPRRSRAPEVSGLVLTGQGSGRERMAAIALGVRHFLVKPVETDELVRCVCECAEQPRECAAAQG